jgi:hypothetical protein
MKRRAGNLCKKKTIKLIIWTAMYSVVCLNSYSQYKKNAVVLDLAGKSVYYFDITYKPAYANSGSVEHVIPEIIS